MGGRLSHGRRSGRRLPELFARCERFSCGVVLRCGGTLGDDGVGYSTGFDSDKINKHSRGISMVFRKLQKRKNQRKKCVHEFELDTLL